MKALKKYLGWIAVGCAVVAVIMCLLPFGAKKQSAMGIEVEMTASGFAMIFGGDVVMKAMGMTEKSEAFAFSVMNLLPVLLVVAGAVCAYLGKKNGNKIMNYVAIGCFAVAAILFFCALNFVQPAKSLEIPKDMVGEWRDSVKESIDLGIGAIIAGIVSIVGAAAVAVDTFVPVKE